MRTAPQMSQDSLAGLPTHTGKGLWVSRLLYFFYFAALGIMVNYLNVYFREIGLNGTQIGLINTLAALVSIGMGPVWGMISDRFGMIRPLLVGAAAGSILAAVGLSQVFSYAWIILFAVLFTMFSSPLMPLLDSVTLKLLGGQRERYGRQRVWGSLGFIITVWTMGYFLQWAGLHYLFYGYIIVMLPFLLVALFMPVNRSEMNVQVGKGVSAMVRRPVWLIFSASLILLGIGNSGMNNYLGITIKELGGNEGLIGIAGGLATVTELPILFFGAALLSRVGAKKLLAISYLVFALRWFLYGLMPSPEWVIPIALLHGASFGAYWIAGVAYINDMAPDSIKATAQGLLVATIYLSAVLGASLGGLLLDWIGSSKMFFTFSGFGILAVFLLFLNYSAVGKEQIGRGT